MSNEERLINIISEHLSVDKDKVVPTAGFVDNLGADSLDLLELTMSMEEEFSIEIPDEDAEDMTTVNDVFDYINKITN